MAKDSVSTDSSQAEQTRISADTVVAAIRALMRMRPSRGGHSAVVGYLALKAREAAPNAVIEVRSAGSGSVESELERYFAIAPGRTFPYVNPFGPGKQGHLDWLGKDYARYGTYTHLYEAKALDRLLDVDRSREPFTVRIPNTAASSLTQLLGGRIPLEPAAAFLLRRESLSKNPDQNELVGRLQQVFHFSDPERDDLFLSDPSFPLAFDTQGFVDGVESLPPDLHPPTPAPGQTVATEAASTVVGLAPSDAGALVLDDTVERRARRALARSSAVVFVGPPGTGKSRLVSRLVADARERPGDFSLTQPPQFDQYAAETDWTARTIIGGYYPQPDGSLVYQEGYLLTALRHNRWLVLDEMNRADLDRVLGPVLTFLAGQPVNLGRDKLSDDGKPMLLAWGIDSVSSCKEGDKERVYVAGTDWRFIGTYNNVDLGRVFTMGAALSRRWATVPVPPVNSSRMRDVLKQVDDLPAGAAAKIQDVYALHLEYLPLGPAPFVDMARYVADDDATATPVGGATGAMTEATAIALRDAYVLQLKPQLRRMDPDRLQEFIGRLKDILGAAIGDEFADGGS